jgi:hypothetical protein
MGRVPAEAVSKPHIYIYPGAFEMDLMPASVERIFASDPLHGRNCMHKASLNMSPLWLAGAPRRISPCLYEKFRIDSASAG